ncbi:MAG: hypothetical protein SNJ57_09380 [Cyanobacteriota bacterium]
MIALLATFLGLAINNYIRSQAERARKAIHRKRIQAFINTANEIENTTHRLTLEIPIEIMQEILQQASIGELYAIQAAIAKAKAATQRLETSHLSKINAIAKGIGLPEQKQLADTKGGQPNHQNGGNLDKAGKKLIGEMRSRLQQNGTTIEFNDLLTILRERHGIETPADFAALPDEKRKAIESAL